MRNTFTPIWRYTVCVPMQTHTKEQRCLLQIEIGEYTINNQVEDILEGIYKAKPDVLCFSCYIWNIACVNGIDGRVP